MAARKTRTTTVTTVAPLDVTHTLAKAKPATCGKAYDVLVTTFGPKADIAPFAAEGCKRLPRHHGDHKAEPVRGLMTKAQRARAAQVTKAKPGKAARPTRLTKAGLKDLRTSLTQAVEDGSLTASEALSRLSAANDRYIAQSRRTAPKAATA